MAPTSPAPSDHGEEEPKTKKKTSSKVKNESEVEDSEAQSEGEEGDEEEYEIEAILDAKRGQFEKGKLGYYVKWKGYSDEHNSWVMEEDAANAPEAIKVYWDEREREKKKSPKKAAEIGSKRSRKSVGDDNASDAGGSASAAKKRGGGGGRKSVSAKATDKDDDERPAKKPRKNTEKKTPAARTTSPEAVAEAEEENIGNMAEHMHAPTWDQMIKQIDTVERVENTLYVYFTLNDGGRVKEDSEICKEKFPKKLIEFYENNLRWKEADA
ncbi:hypothetical protein DFH07DRAFT_794237 [Mycena maculata]|uniref:Chromo domain-containing protein n=1 Tax=Mycena maculata TaxID=230809 RepID=A0AAD7K897_9AGAR|nr:hypothetical protein DFH07DRAFT_794237 [Mycena maculata]